MMVNPRSAVRGRRFGSCDLHGPRADRRGSAPQKVLRQPAHERTRLFSRKSSNAPGRERSMKIVSLETIPVSVPYRQAERSFRVQRGGVTDVIVKLVTDTGLVGWGEIAAAPMSPRSRRRCGRWRRSSSAATHGTRRRSRATSTRRALGLSRRHRQLCLRRHRHGALGSVRQGCRPAALPAVRRRDAARGGLFLLPTVGAPEEIAAQCRDASRAATASST